MSLDRFNGRPIFPLASKTGLVAWLDYLPVKQESDGRANSFDAEGFFVASSVLSSVAAGTALADRDGLAASQLIDVAADVNDLAASQTFADGETLVLEAVAASLVPPRKITLTSGVAANFSTVTFTIVGIDEAGLVASEDLLGPNNSTVTGVKVYSSVESITPDATEAVLEVSAGWAANAVPYPMTLNGVYGNGYLAQSDMFPASRVSLYSTGNVSTISFTIAGLDGNGHAYSERLTGPNNTTVVTKETFIRVDSVTPSDDLITVAVEVGIQSEAMVAWKDYVPVYVEAGATIPWVTDTTTGFVPYEDVTP